MDGFWTQVGTSPVYRDRSGSTTKSHGIAFTGLCQKAVLRLRVRRAGTEHNTGGNSAASIDSNSFPLCSHQLGVVTHTDGFVPGGCF